MRESTIAQIVSTNTPHQYSERRMRPLNWNIFLNTFCAASAKLTCGNSFNCDIIIVYKKLIKK